MNFSALYRASFYLMLTLATLVLSVEATNDNRFAMVYPPAVALASVVAFLTVDRNPKLGMSRRTFYAFWGISTALIFIEYRMTEHLLLSLAHWLVYHQLMLMFLQKNVENDWLMFALGLMQVLVGTVISQSDLVGAALMAWAMSALWVLGLFYLHREALRHRQEPGTPATPEPVRGTDYPGLFDLPFVFSSLRVVAITLALGGIIFLGIPRSRAAGTNTRSGQMARYLTGFGDEVQLGQLGEILENDSVVMSIELTDSDRNVVTPSTELLWRGISMGEYEAGRWRRIRVNSRSFSSNPRQRVAPSNLLVQHVKLEPTNTTVLFGLRPVLDVETSHSLPPELSMVDGSIHRVELRTGTYDYVVWSQKDPMALQPFEEYPSTQRMELMLQVPEPLKTHLKAIAEPLVAKIPASNLADRARALESYLRDGSRFGYTLQMDVTDASIDPVEDFLVNRKEGHCAYFASALTLLLRSIDIPARMVNGFKGGDWNDLARVLTVRQKHAHSWVEALMGAVPSEERPRRAPVWLTLDPTPAFEREQLIERVGGISYNIRLFSDFFRYVWVFYIAGYDAERQNRLIYDPVKQLITHARGGYLILIRSIREAIGALLHFPNLASFFSMRGFFVSFFALLMLALMYRILRWVFRRLVRWWHGDESDSSPLSAGGAFYRRLAHLLAEYGLQRPPAETPLEFARRASGFLSSRGPESEPVADVPPQVVDAFYRIRFGQLELDGDAFRRIEARLDALEALLRT
jgi:protein-glutamine gamma-glutamyltransferase